MRKPLAVMYDAIREALGAPASLYRLLDAQSDLRTKFDESPQVIAAESVVKWHEWGTAPFDQRLHHAPGELPGWRYCGGSYSSFHAARDEFANFGTCEITEGWQCDIQNMTGLGASKSDLTLASLDAMAERASKELIYPITEGSSARTLRTMIYGFCIRIPRTIFSPVTSGMVGHWNSGGSHHFAAARYIAARLKIPVPLR